MCLTKLKFNKYARFAAALLGAAIAIVAGGCTEDAKPPAAQLGVGSGQEVVTFFLQDAGAPIAVVQFDSSAKKGRWGRPTEEDAVEVSLLSESDDVIVDVTLWRISPETWQLRSDVSVPTRIIFVSDANDGNERRISLDLEVGQQNYIVDSKTLHVAKVPPSRSATDER